MQVIISSVLKFWNNLTDANIIISHEVFYTRFSKDTLGSKKTLPITRLTFKLTVLISYLFTITLQ